MFEDNYYKKLLPLLQDSGFGDDQIDQLTEQYKDLAILLVKLFVKDQHERT